MAVDSLSHLPVEILVKILTILDVSTLLLVGSVCPYGGY
jgi:hypothetical protein